MFSALNVQAVCWENICQQPALCKRVQVHEIMTHEYNLWIHGPKGDSCNKCAEFKATPSDLQTSEKIATNKGMRIGRKLRINKDVAITALKTLLVSFDLENVFALPRTTVSSAFYKCKLNA